MKRRAVLRMLTAGATGVALSGCWPFGPAKVTYRYRLTVEVDTPQGLRTGSAVREVTTTNPMGLGSTSEVRGEAVAVDLPNGKTLFALISVDPTEDYLAPATLYPQGTYSGADPVSSVKKAIANHAVMNVPRVSPSDLSSKSRWPVFIVFEDINNPGSAKNVDPFADKNILGAGYSIRRVTVQITDSAVTQQINDRLPWLREYAERTPGSTGYFSATSFSTERIK